MINPSPSKDLLLCSHFCQECNDSGIICQSIRFLNCVLVQIIKSEKRTLQKRIQTVLVGESTKSFIHSSESKSYLSKSPQKQTKKGKILALTDAQAAHDSN